MTIAIHGSIAHHDSTGHAGVIHAGDVQWMTAGRGILHKEYHELEYSKRGGAFQMIQLWVNLPAKDKMVNPTYQNLTNESLGKHQTPVGNLVEVIAGSYKNARGPARTYSPMEMYIIHYEAEEEITLTFPQHFNAALLAVESSLTLAGEIAVAQDHCALFSNDGGAAVIKGQAGSKCFFFAGQPIEEPIAAHGPFLMNTYEEIRQAYADLRQGMFGELE